MTTPLDAATSLTWELRWIKPDGAVVPLVVRIGRPTPDPRGDEWACPSEIDGLDDRYADMVGVSSIQAMALALRLVRTMLADTIQRGAALYLPGALDEPLDLAMLDVLFGLGPGSRGA